MKAFITHTLFFVILSNISGNLLAEENQPQEKDSFWSNVKQTAQSAATNVSEKAKSLSAGASDSVSEFGEYSDQAFEDFMLGVEQNIQVLEKMGYVVTDLYIGVDLVPSVSFRIAKVTEVDLDKQQKLLAEQDNRVLKYIVEKLNSAYAMEFGDYQIKAVKMDLGLPPKTSVHFINLTAQSHTQKYME